MRDNGIVGTFSAPPCRLRRAGNADPVLLHQEQVQPEDRERGQGKNHDVQGIEAGQRVAGHVSPPRANSSRSLPTQGTTPTIAVPTRVAKKANWFQGSK